MVQDLLLRKYNVPVPRYTSYPTVPYWQDNTDAAAWQQLFQDDFAKQNPSQGISLYIHLPFCESLCTYCGCNKKITTHHEVEELYIAAIHREWEQYRALMNERPVIRELHLGGGTPTFFSADNLKKLLSPILQQAHVPEKYEFSFEGHPNNTTREHLQVLYDLGFRRVSYGVQDNDPEVQRIINRIQPVEHVMTAIQTAREIGYKSVNFDLVYGLPRQTADSIIRTINEVIQMRPDRIAFYSYAHVPWTSRGQRLFDEQDLPSAAEKMQMYLLGKQLFTGAGYYDIGMDHFALENDDLYIAWRQGRLHRNFMGYTTQNTDILIGLGVSAISSTKRAYAQNEKTLHDYYTAVNNGAPAVRKGYFLNDEDRRFGDYIMNISCNGYTQFAPQDMDTIINYSLPVLEEMQHDGLIEIGADDLLVTVMGRNFTRNICSAFDLHLLRNRVDKERKVFSKAV